MTTLHPFDDKKLHLGTKCQLRNGDTACILGKSTDPLVSHYAIIGLHQFAGSTKQAPISWDKDGKFGDVNDENCRKFDIVGIYPSENRAENNAWFNVEDQLPAHEQIVLTYRDSFKRGDLFTQAIYLKDKGFVFYADGRLSKQPTHWKPLPEPPKESKNGKAK